MMKRLLILCTIIAGMAMMDSAADAHWRGRWRGGRGFYGPRTSLRIGIGGYRPYRGFYGYRGVAPVGYYAPAYPVYSTPAYYGGPVYGGYYTGGGYYGGGYCY